MNKWRTHQKIEKDRAKRRRRREAWERENINYDAVYQFDYYRRAIRACKKGVRYKRSVQLCLQTPITYSYRHIRRFRAGDFSADMNKGRVTIYERGKARKIVPIRIYQRVYEHVLDDNILLPIFKNLLIFNNGASMKGKGTDFARRQVNKDLWRATQKYGSDFYILQFDFKNYFESIPHKTIYQIMKKHLKRTDALEMTMNIILSYRRAEFEIQHDKGELTEPEYVEAINRLERYEEHGVSLGSQTSQIIALIAPNALDHYIKDTLRVKFYNRYMDDGILFVKTKETAQEILALLKKKVLQLGLQFSPKKTLIIKASKGFTFLKVHYYVTKAGGIIKKLHRKSVVRMRRKLHQFRGLVERGRMRLIDVYNSVQSWFSHSFVASAYRVRMGVAKQFKKVFQFKPETGRKMTRKRCLAAYL